VFIVARQTTHSKVVGMTEIILGHNDISITEADFELFWRQHQWENREWYSQIGAYKKRTHNNPALIEYQLCSMGGEGYAGVTQDIPRATIRFQKLPSGKQRISLHVHRDKDQEDDFRYPIRSAFLSGQETEEAFTAFITYLHEQGRPVEQRPTNELLKLDVSANNDALTLDLYDKLINRCDLDDLKDICFFMGEVDSDSYPGEKENFIRELLRDLQKQGRLDELVETLRQRKDWVFIE
jgi:hypothetical protein